MPENVQNYSINAAEKFIQTAVFVDDQIYRRDENVEQAINEPQEREPAIDDAGATDVPNNEGAEATDFVPEASTAYDIVNSFADKKIVCSIYSPTRDDWNSQIPNIQSLCGAADVVILDWVFFGRHGGGVCDLINGIIGQAQNDTPEQLRLVLIYTRVDDLFSVASQIRGGVTHIPDDYELLDDEGKFTIQVQNFRVVVLGRPITTREGTPANHLANVAIQEFAKLAQGLLQAAILLGLAEIRNNSRKILSRFDHQLDSAFLTHLAMSPSQEDASSHIIPLIGAEIEAILEDKLTNRLIDPNWLEDWCKNVWKHGNHLNQIFSDQGLNETQINNLNYEEIAINICKLGFKEARIRSRIDNSEKYAVPDIGKFRGAQKASTMLFASNESRENERLAQLVASRTFYDKRRKALKPGCILLSDHDRRYFICIQPVCDSVNIRNMSVFIFVELKVVSQANGGRTSHIIFNDDGSALRLFYDPKPKFCHTATFESDSQSNQVIQKEENGELYFEDIDNKRYYWKDQLRTSHAQRAVEQFARHLSRVGLTESEWLRRLSEGK